MYNYKVVVNVDNIGNRDMVNYLLPIIRQSKKKYGEILLYDMCKLKLTLSTGEYYNQTYLTLEYKKEEITIKSKYDFESIIIEIMNNIKNETYLKLDYSEYNLETYYVKIASIIELMMNIKNEMCSKRYFYRIYQALCNTLQNKIHKKVCKSNYLIYNGSNKFENKMYRYNNEVKSTYMKYDEFIASLTIDICICETLSVKEFNPHNNEYEEYKWDKEHSNAIHKSNNKYYLWTEEAEWGFDVLEIKYCPFCGKKL